MFSEEISRLKLLALLDMKDDRLLNSRTSCFNCRGSEWGICNLCSGFPAPKYLVNDK